MATEALALIPVAVAFHAYEDHARPATLALPIGVIGTCGAAVGHMLNIAGVTNWLTEAAAFHIAWAAVGLWLVLGNRPTAPLSRLAPGLARLGRVAGAALLLQMLAFFLFGGPSALLNLPAALANYPLLLGVGLTLGVGLAALTAWSLMLARALTGTVRSRLAVRGL